MSTHFDARRRRPRPVPDPRPAADAGCGPDTPAAAPVPDGAGAPAGARGPDDSWQERYAATVAVVDLALLAACVLVGILLDTRTASTTAFRAHATTGAVAGVLVVLALPAVRAWEPRVLGNGAAEFHRLGRAVLGSAVLLALIGVGLQVESVRPWVFGVLPAFGGLAALGRYGLRRRLHHRRRAERCVLPVLAVGSPASVADLVARTRRDVHFGWVVRGACTSTGTGAGGGPDVDGVPVVGDLSAVAAAVSRHGYRVVAVSPAPGWGPRRLRELAWELEGTDTELAVDPGLMEVAGPRLHITPVDGLPLVRLTQPCFTGSRRALKLGMDRVGAALLVLLLAPVLVGLAVAVRRDGGPALYRQRRVGVNGRTFTMVKFRTMRVGADRELPGLAGSSDGSGPLFKMHADPRVTRVGAVLRRHSLDELPQLFNVLGGTMSLVGPRPPLPGEVAAYAEDAKRRLLVRPGMTGLWQVSGRSDLSWEETVRLDLRYVENWSVALDLTILWKTLNAVVGGRGAY